MTDNIIGYRGVESAEVLLYIARILQQIGMNVLICDYTEYKSIEYSIPFSNELDTSKHCIDYMGISYTRKMLDQALLRENQVVLIHFGFLDTHIDMKRCKDIHYITDMNRFNVKRLIRLNTEDGVGRQSHFILRDVMYAGMKPKAVIHEIKEKLGIEEHTLIKLNQRDMKIKLLSQYNAQFAFKGISNDLFHYLYSVVMKLCPNHIETRRVNKAFDLAMKGRCHM